MGMIVPELVYGLIRWPILGSPILTLRYLWTKQILYLTDSHIGNSRDASFEDMIRRETNGKGVDLVLNSLSDEKLQVSLSEFFFFVGSFSSFSFRFSCYWPFKKLTSSLDLNNLFNHSDFKI